MEISSGGKTSCTKRLLIIISKSSKQKVAKMLSKIYSCLLSTCEFHVQPNWLSLINQMKMEMEK
jgi:hypothetical protein